MNTLQDKLMAKVLDVKGAEKVADYTVRIDGKTYEIRADGKFRCDDGTTGRAGMLPGRISVARSQARKAAERAEKQAAARADNGPAKRSNRNNPHEGSPKKLRDGSWGVMINAKGRKVRVNNYVNVCTRSGKQWLAQITDVVWSGDGLVLCRTRNIEDTPKPQRAEPLDPQSPRAILASLPKVRAHGHSCPECEDPLTFGHAPGRRFQCRSCGRWGVAS
jgi:hypothetical protein